MPVSTFSCAKAELMPDHQSYEVKNGAMMPNDMKPREKWQMEHNQLNHDRYLTQYNEMYQRHNEQLMTDCLNQVESDTLTDSKSLQGLRTQHAKQFGYDRPGVEAPPLVSNKGCATPQKDKRFKSPPFTRVNPVSRMAFRRYLDDNRPPDEVAAKNALPLSLPTGGVSLGKQQHPWQENWRLPGVTPRSRWPSQRKATRWSPSDLEVAYTNQRAMMRRRAGLPPEEPSTAGSGGATKSTAMIQHLSSRLDTLEKELQARNAILEGGAPLGVFPMTEGPHPAHTPMPRSRSRSELGSGSATFPLPRSKSQQQFQPERARHFNVGGGPNPTHAHNKEIATKGRLMEEAKKAFAQFDIDNSGSISREELKAALEKGRGKKVPAKELGVLFKHLDANNDGEISFKEFHQAKPMKGAWVQGVGWRWDEGQGGSYNPMAWAYGGTVDQNKSGADGKLVEKTKLIGMQVANGAFKKQAMAGAADEPFVPSDGTVRSDLMACIKNAHGTKFADWNTQNELSMGSLYYPQGRPPENREWPEKRSRSRMMMDITHKRKYAPTKSPQHSYSKYADACINAHMSFTESGGMPASGPILSSNKK